MDRFINAGFCSGCRLYRNRNLYVSLREAPDTLRLKMLEDSLRGNSDVVRMKYARLLLEEATAQENTRCQGTVLFALARYYYTAYPDGI